MSSGLRATTVTGGTLAISSSLARFVGSVMTSLAPLRSRRYSMAFGPKAVNIGA